MGRMRGPSIILILAAATVLGACAPPRFASPPGTYAYRQGWHEGCADGYAVAGSPLYAHKGSAAPGAVGGGYEYGWQAGFNHCQASYGRIQRGIYVLLAPS